MKTFLLFSMTLLFLSSCHRNMYRFEESDTEWISKYDVEDTIRFETNNGTDLLYINEREIKESNYSLFGMAREDIACEEMYGDYNASAELKGFFIHNDNKSEVWIMIFKYSNGGIGAWFNLGWRFCFGVKDSRNMNEEGTSIRDTVIIDDANSEYGGEGPVADDFEYFKWSKKEGLIEYRLRDGTMYPKPKE